MNKITLKLKLITPALCGGASPEKQAEIRVPSIRGQLRWWFRVLGGFKSLPGKSVKEQEGLIFGSVSGTARASQLIVRVKSVGDSKLISNDIKDADGFNARQNTEKGYLLFPLRGKGRACFNNTPNFELILLWKGEKSLIDDIKALGTVFGHFGSLGFRSRRAMGALAFLENPPDFKSALARFTTQNAILIKQVAGSQNNAETCINSLAKWLRGWRSYGRSPNNLSNGPGFKYAEKDHDIAAKRQDGNAMRPALGLPILTKYGNWEESWNFQKRKGEGRFASPVILRPYLDSNGGWKSLVIFVESMKWPIGKKVYLNSNPKDVGLELYEAMKEDTSLSLFQV